MNRCVSITSHKLFISREGASHLPKIPLWRTTIDSTVAQNRQINSGTIDVFSHDRRR